jgi:hypothetical protein
MNLRAGQMDTSRVSKFVLYAFCPAIPVFSISMKLQQLNSTKTQMFGPVFWAKAISASVVLLFYGWLLLVIIDNVDIDHDSAFDIGRTVPGGLWNGVSFSNDTVTHVSQRYGMYKRYPVDPAAGQPVLTDADLTNQTRFPQFHPELLQAGSGLGGLAVGAVGDRIGNPLHYAVIGWYFYLTFITIIMTMRNQVRECCGLAGNIVEDFFSPLFLYPSTLIQMEEMLPEMGKAKTSQNVASDNVETPSQVEMKAESADQAI